MRSNLRALTIMSVAACGVGLLPAMSASAMPATGPSDCTFTKIDAYTGSLTCTNRPATQHWDLDLICGPFALDADGNIVTGNGTSVAHCTYAGIRSWEFQID